MKRVFLLVPEGLSFDMLSETQQQAIHAIFGQYVMPMPRTKAHAGTIICDAVCDDSFNPNNMGALGLAWDLIGMWQWSGGAVTELVSLDTGKYQDRLQDDPVIDSDGKVTGYTPAVANEKHKWSGWPDCF